MSEQFKHDQADVRALQAQLEALLAAPPMRPEPSQLVYINIRRMETLADSALDGRPWEKECQAQMRLAINLLREAYALPPSERETT